MGKSIKKVGSPGMSDPQGPLTKPVFMYKWPLYVVLARVRVYFRVRVKIRVRV